MNRLLFTVIISWQTRNWRRGRQAEKWCRDYGLVKVHKNLYSGKLYLRERSQFNQKMTGLLAGKHDVFCSFVMCASCAPNSFVTADIHNPPWIDSLYEIVQTEDNP